MLSIAFVSEENLAVPFQKLKLSLFPFPFPFNRAKEGKTIMAAESVRAASSVCNFNGSQRRPAAPTPLSRTQFLLRSSRPSRSHFFGTNLRLTSSPSSNLCISRQQSRPNLSVFAMAAEGIYSFFFFYRQFSFFKMKSRVFLCRCSMCVIF